MSKRKRKSEHVLEKRKDGYYQDGVKLERRDYIFHFNSQHGNSIISGTTGKKYFLDSNRNPI